MKTYTRHSIAGWDVYTDDETGRVHHLVDPDSNDPRTLYPYIPAAGGGWATQRLPGWTWVLHSRRRGWMG